MTPRERVTEFLGQRQLHRGLDPDEIISLDGGDDVEGGISLRVSDLWRLLEKPVIYVSVSGGVAETMRYGGGDVETILIDWDEVTPEDYLDPSDGLDEMDLAVDGSLKLPKGTMIQNMRDMLEWLRDNLLDFPENDGYEQAREIEARIVKILSDNGAHP